MQKRGARTVGVSGGKKGKRGSSARSKLFTASATMAGTIIGAGILGLPYVFAQSGFLIGMFWLVFLSIVLLVSKLYLGEVALRTKGNHQLTGYAQKYLGNWGRRLMFFAMIFGIYSALLAYLIGEGESLSQLFTGSSNYILFFGILFWIVISILVQEGMRGLKKVEKWGVMVIIVIIVGLFIYYLPQVQIENLTYIGGGKFFLPFGIILFALLGFSSLPEIKQELGNSKKLFKKSIIIGSIIPLVLYFMFTFIFVGVLGRNVSEVATLSFGVIVLLLGVFTMLTSFFVLSFVMLDMFRLDFGWSKKKARFYAQVVPVLLFVLVQGLGLLSFAEILGIAGVVSGGLTAVLILMMAKNSKKLGDRKPEYELKINWPIIIILSVIFLLGVIFELFF
jgi:amino acid permease